MRQLTLTYGGECRGCGTALAAGAQGVYEKRVGVFCVPCAPTDPEQIRQLRQEAADRKADRLETWAEKRRGAAEATLAHNREHYWSDWAFVTQPGPMPARARAIAQDDRALGSLRVAERMERRAAGLRNVRVAGDRERERQAQREANDERFGKGDRIFTALHGAGTIVSVHKKSYRVQWDRGYTCSCDKSWAESAR